MYLFALHVYLQMTHSYVTINYEFICNYVFMRHFMCEITHINHLNTRLMSITRDI